MPVRNHEVRPLSDQSADQTVACATLLQMLGLRGSPLHDGKALLGSPLNEAPSATGKGAKLAAPLPGGPQVRSGRDVGGFDRTRSDRIFTEERAVAVGVPGAGLRELQTTATVDLALESDELPIAFRFVMEEPIA